MKPAPFTYHRARTVEEAATLLAALSDEGGRILAGGQTLIPMMAFRLASPSHLIDINRIEALENIRVESATLRIGALARHARFHREVTPGPLGQLLTRVAAHIAHYPIRQRGTYCGSVANADPASEWCLVTATLGGTMVALSAAGARAIGATEYFRSAMTTALQPDELLCEVHLPLPAEQRRLGFFEFSRRAGDFALAMSLASFDVIDGCIEGCQLGVGGVEQSPRRLAEAEAVLNGERPGAELFERAAEAAAAVLEPLDDPQAPAEYRRALAKVVVRRALDDAMSWTVPGQGPRERA